jgi:hypothetical protein
MADLDGRCNSDRRLFLAPERRPHREKTMSDSTGKEDDAVPDGAKPVLEQQAMLAQEHDDDRMEDEEKILAGRHDVNYPAMLTKDVPGG